MKKVLILMLSCVLLTSTLLVGCGKTGKYDKEIDPNKEQLYVGVFDGGWGRAWLDEMAEDFEKLNPGVQVMIEGKKEEFTDKNLATGIESNIHDIYFSRANAYEFVANETEGNKLMDITDAVTTPLTEYGESRSIADKMDPFIKEYTLASNKSGKYYTIPLYTSFYNIVYDVDLFEEESLYFAEDGAWTDGKVDEGANPKSVGQDGKAGTYDDGLPVMYDDFKRLLGRLKSKNICPFIWGNDVVQYRRDYFTNVWATYEGKDNFMLNNTFSGEYTFPAGSFTAAEAKELNINHEVENTITINEDNGYLLQKQFGKKAALQMAKDIVSDDNNFDIESLKGDYLAAQNGYLLSKKKAEEGGKRIAMLIEGGWWENEAKSTLDRMADSYGAEYQNRRFGIMPIPYFENGHKSKVLFSVTPDSVVLIRKNAKKAEWAKKFLRYTTTDENLRRYNRMTGSTRAYDYELTQEDLNSMSYYKRSLWDIYSNSETSLIYSSGPSDVLLKNRDKFRYDWPWKAQSIIDNAKLTEPINEFRQRENLEVDDYFNSLYKTHKDNWHTLNK